MAEFLREYILEDDSRDDHYLRASNESNSSETVVAKAVAMVCLFTASFVMGLLPIKLSKWFDWESDTKNRQIVSLLLCFGGGVLMCTTFLHLLPEVAEHVDLLIHDGLFPDTKIPFAELLMCIGFFVMYFVEECVHVYLHRREAKNDLQALRRSLSIRRGEMNADESAEASSNSSANLVKCDEELGKVKDFEKLDELKSHHHNHAGHSHIMVEQDSVVLSIRGLLVVMALSVHELFEGLAVGLESSASLVWYMFGAVAAHKFVIAFCIGVELVSSKNKTLLTVIYVFTFSVVSPLGIGIGIAVSADQNNSTALLSMILQGLATGTLLYVVFFEILQKDQTGGMKRYFAIFVGFVIMFGLTIFRIGIGLALSEAGGSQEDITSVVLQGMAAGTLLYVVFFEVLARERSNHHSGLWQLLAILAGFAVMFGLQFITGHDHSHGAGAEHHEKQTQFN